MKNYTDLNSFPNWAKVEKDEFSVSVIKGLVLDAKKSKQWAPRGANVMC